MTSPNIHVKNHCPPHCLTPDVIEQMKERHLREHEEPAIYLVGHPSLLLLSDRGGRGREDKYTPLGHLSEYCGLKTLGVPTFRMGTCALSSKSPYKPGEILMPDHA